MPPARSGEALRLVPPPSGPADRVRWERLAPPPSPTDSAALVASEPLWRARATHPKLVAPALRRLAIARLARRDTAGADSCWAALAARASFWQWDAIRARVEIACARGDTASADALLGKADASGWPENERAARLGWHVRTRFALRDTSGAVRLAREAILVYPSLPPANAALHLLTRALAARGDSLMADDERAAAEVDAFRGDAASAARRLERAARLVPAEQRFAVTLRRAVALRGGRSSSKEAARVAALEAFVFARDSSERTRAVIERARACRDGGKPDSALALYAEARRIAPAGTLAFTAAWEGAREAEDLGRWEAALDRFRDASTLGGARVADARFRAGLMHLVLGRFERARAWWYGDSSDAARFWSAVSMRTGAGSTERARGDSALAAVARRPGYTFYRSAARESLASRGWNGRIAPVECRSPASRVCESIALADTLIRLGAVEEGVRVLNRAALRGGGATPPASDPTPAEWDAMAAILYAAGWTGTATNYADRAVRAGEALPDSAQWSYVPWAFPPAYESLFVAHRVDSLGLDASTLMAVARQESRFDPEARSSSNALGLMQLLPGTAADLAKRILREPAPRESTLFVPAISIRYGSRYLAGLIRRFEDRLSVALSAYNAGPSTVPKFWRDLIARGGDALFCEIASNADAQDYTRRILGYRQAYRELRPTTER